MIDKAWELKRETIKQLGYECGKDAGSWVIEGSATPDKASKILAGYEISDPEVMDLQPAPLSGEWSGGLTVHDLFNAAQIRETPENVEKYQEDLVSEFEDGYSSGFWKEVVTNAEAIVARAR